MDQREILRIVQKWRISWRPEYRGFRCAKCQRLMRKAWHVWLRDGGYKVEVHFCKECFARLRGDA